MNEEEVYIVCAMKDRRGSRFQNNYCDTFEEAYELALDMERDWPWIEILKGTPGHYMRVWCNWVQDKNGKFRIYREART